MHGRKVVTREHPLRLEAPEEWKNIPACLALAIKNIIAHVVIGNENLFEFQTKQNERLYRV